MKNGAGITVNFSGPSGTGKSSTAEALANALGISIIRIDAGDVISSVLGGSAKALSAIMDRADEEPVLLFFDEADVLLSKRQAGSGQAAEQEISSLKGRLLTRLDTFKGIVVFATNFPAVYDAAFKRRIIFQIPFDYPAGITMQEMIRFHLADLPSSVSLPIVSEAASGLSGGDIKSISIRLASKVVSGKLDSITTEDYAEMIAEYRNAWTRDTVLNNTARL